MDVTRAIHRTFKPRPPTRIERLPLTNARAGQTRLRGLATSVEIVTRRQQNTPNIGLEAPTPDTFVGVPSHEMVTKTDEMGS